MRSPSATADMAPAILATTHPAQAPQLHFHRVWPPAAIGFGLGLTAAWICLLGYGLVSLIALAFSGAV
jgi:hypothetical protein